MKKVEGVAGRAVGQFTEKGVSHLFVEASRLEICSIQPYTNQLTVAGEMFGSSKQLPANAPVAVSRVHIKQIQEIPAKADKAHCPANELSAVKGEEIPCFRRRRVSAQPGTAFTVGRAQAVLNQAAVLRIIVGSDDKHHKVLNGKDAAQYKRIIEAADVSNHNLGQIRRVNDILATEDCRFSTVQSHFSLPYRNSIDDGILSSRYNPKSPLPTG